MTGTPWVVDDDRGGLAAQTLQPVERLNLLARHLDEKGNARRDGAGHRQALFLIGEGGIGKSVLLGQYLDSLASGGDRGVVLVCCDSIEPRAELGTLASANLALVSKGLPVRGSR